MFLQMGYRRPSGGAGAVLRPTIVQSKSDVESARDLEEVWAKDFVCLCFPSHTDVFFFFRVADDHYIV